MELHTLGVDGGYTQKDVTEVARCFTGWTIFAPRGGGAAPNGVMQGRAPNSCVITQAGFSLTGAFMTTAKRLSWVTRFPREADQRMG